MHVDEDLRSHLVPEPLRAAVGGALVGCIAIWLPNVYGVGYGTISAALTSQLSAITLAALIVAKIAATSITIGSGGPRGEKSGACIFKGSRNKQMRAI